MTKKPETVNQKILDLSTDKGEVGSSSLPRPTNSKR